MAPKAPRQKGVSGALSPSSRDTISSSKVHWRPASLQVGRPTSSGISCVALLARRPDASGEGGVPCSSWPLCTTTAEAGTGISCDFFVKTRSRPRIANSARPGACREVQLQSEELRDSVSRGAGSIQTGVSRTSNDLTSATSASTAKGVMRRNAFATADNRFM